MSTMGFADLEIKLTHHADNAYVVDARFRHAGSNEATHPEQTPIFVRIDLPLLLERTLDPISYGQQLTQMFFADPTLIMFFQRARSAAQGAGVPLRVRLWLDQKHPELHSIRWEMLQAPGQQEPEFLFPKGSLLFSRYLSSPDMEQIIKAPVSMIRALVVISSPNDLTSRGLAPIDVADELERARNALGDIPTTILTTQTNGTLVTIAALSSKLQENFDILYLVCHGTSREKKLYILLERKDGSTHPVAIETFVQQISNLPPKSRPKLIVLASCGSAGQSHSDANPLLALGPQLAQRGIGAVLAMNDNIPMATIATGMPIFFRQLRQHGSVDLALAEARNVLLSVESAWWQPVLFLRLADGQLWQNQQASRKAEATASDMPLNLADVHPAIRQRLIQPVEFREDELANDYYEGKQARTGHIAASLDAPRPHWQRAISDVLRRTQVCVIRASSGQGKSTLLYRQAYESQELQLVLLLRRCTTDEQANTILDYLYSIGVPKRPLLILVDNLDHRTSHWHEIVSELAGTQVRFLVSTREEDWYRYGRGTTNFSYEVLTPRLSLQEANDVFRYFQRFGNIAPNIRSAHWAYEQVAEQKLLIEFVYLITHGQMLAERIYEQVRIIEHEDPGKLEALRLVATAHLHDARIPERILRENVVLRGDSHFALRSLEGEYLLLHDGEYEGLHRVRSEHLVRSLHTAGSVNNTVQRLVQILDHPNLLALTTSVFSDDTLDCPAIVPVLITRCAGRSVRVINEVVDALFTASEIRYFHSNKHLFDEAVDRLGYWAISLLSGSTLPIGGTNIIQQLSEVVPGRPNAEYLRELVTRFSSRETAGTQRDLRLFLQGMTGLVNIERDSESFSDIATLSLWYQFASLPSSDFNAFFNGTQWETRLLDEPGEQVSSFLQALHEQAPERYGSFLDGYKERLQRKFCLSFETLTLEERDNDVYIEFIINESVGAESINNQAVSRLQHLWRWFPRYTRYCSQGFDVRTGGTPITPDDSHKEMANTTLAQMAHVSKNVLYNRLINERYTAPSLDEWLKQWYQVRKQWLMLVEAVGSVYESRYRGKTPDYRAVRSLGAEVLRLYVQTPDLPEKVREQLQQQVQTIRTWGNTVHAFVQQFFQHNPEENNHDAFLMRVNLRDALRTLPEMHTAFRHVFAFAIDEMNMQLLNTKESREYMYLYDILDYWFTVPTRSASNLRHTVKIWREQEERDQANAVRESLSELAEAGMSFSYPNGLVSIDTALTGLCIGYEIIDFEQQPVQIGLICQYISGIDINYSFLYLVPTVQRHLHGSVIRISRENLQRIAAGEAVNDVYPVSAPVGLTAILPDIDLTPLPEVTLFSPAAEACVRLVMERNRIYFARTHLQQNTAESQTILQYYEHSAAEKAREAVDSFGVAYAGAINWSVPNNALPAWRELWEGCRTLVEELSDHNTIIGGYLPQPALQFPILDQLYNRYLNIRYRM